MRVVNGYQSAMCGQQVVRQKGGHITRHAPLKYKKSTYVLDDHPPSTPINPLNEHVTLGYRVD